jgi:exodeoxyribonuclease-3
VKLLCWNVNGLRAAHRSGFLDWFEAQAADVVCVQETRVRPEEVAEELLHPFGYHSYWAPAEKRGYSGVTTFCKRKPLQVRQGIGKAEFDREGHVLLTEFPTFLLVNSYFPNSQRGAVRLPYKLKFCTAMLRMLNRYRRAGKHIVLCGDYNIAHKPIDLSNPKQNVRNAGYLPEERAWMDRFTRHGYVDTFRHFCDEPGNYTFWSQRGNCRERNIGWRLDYFCVSPELAPKLKSAAIHPEVMGSDHCPIELQLKR